MEKNYDPADFCGVLCDFAEDIINHQKARIEQLTQVAEQQTSLAIERHFEIKRLEEDNKRLKEVQMQLDDAMKMYNVIKAEAYKEFAERLKKRYFSATNFNDELREVVAVETIDTLLKEKLGGGK